jgi:hypothetical protein
MWKEEAAMTRIWKPTLVVFLALAAVSPAFSQEDGFSFGLGIGIGATTYDEDGTPMTYQSLTLTPDIAFGKIGIGLDITLNYTFTGPPPGGTDFYVREEDWIPKGNDNILDVYLPKFKYIRYGFKGDPLYAKFGSIDDATLGNGFIMGNYANTLFLPEKRLFGLSFDFDGTLLNFPYLGFESFIANLAQYDVMGVRPYVRPLASTEIPILKNLQLGGTLAVDTDPGLYAGLDLETVTLYGVDFRQPLLAKDAISLAVFGDLARLHERSWGGMIGFGGRLVKIITYGAQVRILGENFVPVYFDAAYDLYRYDKWQIAKSVADIPAYNGWLASLGTSLFNDLLVFSVSLDGPFSQPEPANPDNYLNYPHLYAIFQLGEGLVPNVSFDASYDKRSLETGNGAINFFEDLVDREDAVIKARINYAIGRAVISFVYQIRWDPVANDWMVTSGVESAIQLF